MKYVESYVNITNKQYGNVSVKITDNQFECLCYNFLKSNNGYLNKEIDELSGLSVYELRSLDGTLLAFQSITDLCNDVIF